MTFLVDNAFQTIEFVIGHLKWIEQTVCCVNDVGVTIYFAINCAGGHSLDCAWVMHIGA
jgi:hypothetical protein